MLGQVHHQDELLPVALSWSGETAGLDASVHDLGAPDLVAAGPPKQGVVAYRARRAGAHPFEGSLLRLRDASATFQEERVYRSGLVVQVLAPLRAIREARLASRHRRESEARHQDPVGQLPRQFAFETLRDFVPGDRLRDLDWKRASRLDRLMTKLPEREADAALLLVLDCSRTMRFRRSGPSALERAGQLCLQMAQTARLRGRPVGFIAVDEARVTEEIAPAASDVVIRRIEGLLARLPAPLQPAREPPVLWLPPEKSSNAFLGRLDMLHPRTHHGARSFHQLGRRVAVRHDPGSLLVLMFTDFATSPRAVADTLLEMRSRLHAVACAHVESEADDAEVLDEATAGQRYERAHAAQEARRRLAWGGVEVADATGPHAFRRVLSADRPSPSARAAPARTRAPPTYK